MKSLPGIDRPAPWWRSILFWGGVLVAGYLAWVSWDARNLGAGNEATMIRLNTEPPQTLIVDERGYRFYPGRVMVFIPGGGPCGGGGLRDSQHVVAVTSIGQFPLSNTAPVRWTADGGHDQDRQEEKQQHTPPASLA